MFYLVFLQRALSMHIYRMSRVYVNVWIYKMNRVYLYVWIGCQIVAVNFSMVLFFTYRYISEGMDVQNETCISVCMDRLSNICCEFLDGPVLLNV